ncbi:hypothetical protein BDZ94DRAFT_1249445 [Collybia nuda]|uniref:Uncharacterized protein n=1 Tax=Collybia nuda TaxID=64659 RepID=A0A9P5YCB5_9AGAR|nr:hypothetical protein BDZ94DRAFT_1249445 [Collybia nuda]
MVLHRAGDILRSTTNTLTQDALPLPIILRPIPSVRELVLLHITHILGTSIACRTFLILDIKHRRLPDPLTFTQQLQQRRVHVQAGAKHKQQVAQWHFRLLALSRRSLDELGHRTYEITVLFW